MYCENVFCFYVIEIVLGYMLLFYYFFIFIKGYSVIDSNGDFEYLLVIFCDIIYVFIYIKWMCIRWVVVLG